MGDLTPVQRLAALERLRVLTEDRMAAELNSTPLDLEAWPPRLAQLEEELTALAVAADQAMKERDGQ